MTYTEELLSMIHCSPSCFHAVKELCLMLTNAGFTRLEESRPWEIKPGGSYFVTRNQSSLLAFRVPEQLDAPRFMIASAHSDSPTFKIKDIPELDGAGMYTRINTERYGGMILDSWFDRPLSVAGRVLVRTDCGVTTKLVNIDRDLLLIPHIAIHMENTTNSPKAWNPASDLVPLYGDAAAKGTFLKLIAEGAEVKPEDMISHELFLYNRQAPTVWGANNEFISAPKLDDLECAWSAVKALIEASPKAIACAMVMDNEEVGSHTKQGAGSTFLADTLARICCSLGGDIRMAAAESMMLSADNAHAVHPNNPSLADPTHRPKMNGGVVLKFNASQTYTTDAVSAAVFREICRKADVPVQVFANRSDMRGGSTLGNISNSQVSMSAVDIGLAQLAMHSSYETAGAADVAHMVSCMRAFYGTKLSCTDGNVTME